MIVPDVNLLLYAHVAAFREHAPARRWWEVHSNDSDFGSFPRLRWVNPLA